MILRAAGLALTGALLSQLLKKDSPVFSFLICFASAAALLLLVSGPFARILERVRGIAESSGAGILELMVLFRALGIALATRFASRLAADADLKAVESGMELCGAAAVLYVSLPLMESVLELIGGLL